MVILRPTRKLQKLLEPQEDPPITSNTGLGDWYINRIVVDRRPLLLAVSALSFFAVLIRAQNVRSFPGRLPELVSDRLVRLGIARELVQAEVEAMKDQAIAPTASRRVLGVMNDFARMIPYHLDPNDWDESDLRDVEERHLWRTPCLVTSQDGVFPNQEEPRLLQGRWDSV